MIVKAYLKRGLVFIVEKFEIAAFHVLPCRELLLKAFQSAHPYCCGLRFFVFCMLYLQGRELAFLIIQQHLHTNKQLKQRILHLVKI